MRSSKKLNFLLLVSMLIKLKKTSLIYQNKKFIKSNNLGDFFNLKIINLKNDDIIFNKQINKKETEKIVFSFLKGA